MASRNELRTWLRSDLGRSLLDQEQAALVEPLEDVFGLHLMQVGEWGEDLRLAGAARVQSKSLWAGEARPGVAVCCDPAMLPTRSDSVDAVLLPHTLEFVPDAYALLRELDRVLVAEGQLIVLGFNVLGSWSWRHRLSQGGFPPGMQRLLREGRVRDWFALLGFEVVLAKRYLFAPPFARLQSGRGRGFFSALAWLAPPLFASGYLLKARKRVYAAPRPRLRWRDRRRLVSSVPEPTARVSRERS
ncbi:MAG TPA: methyltransferase domain-containing protein [Steroidobacteraceae bacterium]|nr:methyltransferase domain-containing protein [Steroidobacteraceae bacterium]